MTQIKIMNLLIRGLQVAVFSSAILAAHSSYAAIIGGIATGGSIKVPATTADIPIIDPPPSVIGNDVIESSNVQAFNEKQNLVLSQDILVWSVFDTSTSTPDVLIPFGSVINSHFVFLDPVPVTKTRWYGEIEFDQEIIGIIPDDRGEFGLRNTNRLLGLEETSYQLAARRLDGGQDFASFDRNVLSFDMTTGMGMDPIRVITYAKSAPAAPEPLTLLGTGTALGIAPLLQRAYSKKKKKQNKKD